MPRQAAASAGFATGTTGTRMLLKPPEDLDQLERVEFVDLITGAPAVALPALRRAADRGLCQSHRRRASRERRTGRCLCRR